MGGRGYIIECNIIGSGHTIGFGVGYLVSIKGLTTLGLHVEKKRKKKQYPRQALVYIIAVRPDIRVLWLEARVCSIDASR